MILRCRPILVAVFVVRASFATDCYVSWDKGAGYRGNVSETRTGYKCRYWNSLSTDYAGPEKYPDSGLVQNYCRNPSGRFGISPWCYSTNPEKLAEYCAIPECEECYDISDLGASYRGKVNQSKSGYACQAWTSQSPWTHTRTPEAHPQAGLESNYCRNPDGEAAPWCLTQDDSQTWEICSIRHCPVDCYNPADSGASYRGSMSRSADGLLCQRWDSQSPHNITDRQYFPTFGLTSNFCRNPDGMTKPWCYTMDPNIPKQYCTIRTCKEYQPKPVQTVDVAEFTTVKTTIFEGGKPLLQDCYSSGDKGAGYRGTVAVTVSGRRCQNWESQYPHRHSIIPERFPDAGLEKNYCRNPGGLSGPWCFTRTRTPMYELCDVPSCRDIIRLVNGGVDYGRVEILINRQWGTICDDDWDIVDATVVCRMLGYSTATSAPGNAQFGRGVGNIWLGRVNCYGNESSLIECPSLGLGINNCDHGEDASVQCA